MTHYDITKQDKLDYLRNEKLLKKSTYHSIAQADLDQERGGRYSTLNKPTFSGSDPSVTVPKQPVNSYWNRDPCGVEPPLGFSVNDQPAVGEIWEQELSMKSEASSSTMAAPTVDDVDSRPTPILTAGSGPAFRRRI